MTKWNLHIISLLKPFKFRMPKHNVRKLITAVGKISRNSEQSNKLSGRSITIQ